MTIRKPADGAVLTGGDVLLIRQVLAACSRTLIWAQANCGPEFAEASGDISQAAGLSRAPGDLAGQASLAIDILDFASPAPQESR
jgi:hypothetical protein